MRLIELVGEEKPTLGKVQPDVEITGLTADSRSVRPGFLFAALPGARLDGRRFIADAVSAGAAAVLAPPDVSREGVAVPLILDANPRRRLAHMAAIFHRAQPETVAAVTGTNGKTSVAAFTHQLWTGLGFGAACLGTLGLIAPGERGGPSLTTPDPVALHRILAGLKQKRVDHLALEASSHGLAQHRLDGVRVRAAAFTNISRDHLDYHGTMAEYRAAKLRLFAELVEADGAAVINAESPEGTEVRRIARRRGLRVIRYGLERGDIRCRRAAPSAEGWDLDLDVLGERFSLHFPLPGAFQVTNALAALGLVVACGADIRRTAPLLAALEGVPGRMQRAARLASSAAVYVDYAHTPDALATVLEALRPHAAGRLVVLFGCGGDRDRGKRPEMGALAASLADRAIVTDDNPRSEDPAAIRREILAACPGADEIGDRRAAIEAAVADLAAGDLLVLAGKGHETGQVVGDRVLPFDDATAACEAVRRLEERDA